MLVGYNVLPSVWLVQADTQNFTYPACSRCSRGMENTNMYKTAPEPGCCGPKSVLTYLYRMNLAFAIEDKWMEAMAFDSVVARLIGCPATEMVTLVRKHPTLPQVLAELLGGRYVSARFQSSSSRQQNTNYVKDPKVLCLQLLDNDHKELTIIQQALKKLY